MPFFTLDPYWKWKAVKLLHGFEMAFWFQEDRNHHLLASAFHFEIPRSFYVYMFCRFGIILPHINEKGLPLAIVVLITMLLSQLFTFMHS